MLLAPTFDRNEGSHNDATRTSAMGGRLAVRAPSHRLRPRGRGRHGFERRNVADKLDCSHVPRGAARGLQAGRHKGARELVPGHALVRLIEHPNDYYDGTALWMATLVSWCLSGNRTGACLSRR
jgi:hypothetical protein